jgi:hypothetical protein
LKSCDRLISDIPTGDGNTTKEKDKKEKSEEKESWKGNEEGSDDDQWKSSRFIRAGNLQSHSSTDHFLAAVPEEEIADIKLV